MNLDKSLKYLNYNCYFATMELKRIEQGIDNIKLEISPKEILNFLDNNRFEILLKICRISPDKLITAANIPQFSKVYDGTLGLINMLKNLGDYGISFIDIGKNYLDSNKKEAAYQKYGENHAKLSRELDLVYIVQQDKSYVYLTKMAYELLTYPEEKQYELIAKMMLFIPIIKYYIKSSVDQEVDIINILKKFLAESTAQRRKSSIRQLLKYIDEYSSRDIEQRNND